jgi:hypothetical protein
MTSHGNNGYNGNDDEDISTSPKDTDDYIDDTEKDMEKV